MTQTPQKVNEIFIEAHKRFIIWMKGKPTGKFSMKIDVSQGGVRGKQKYGIEEDG